VTRVEGDASVCVGSGMCEHIAAKYFDVSSGAVVVRQADVDSADLADVDEAVHSCPTQALTIHAED
jgi:ferredoxin